VKKLLEVPGTEAAVMFSGFDGASQTQASNGAAAYVTFKPFAERAGTDMTEANIIAGMRGKLADMNEALAFVLPPPAIQGIGNGGGQADEDLHALGHVCLPRPNGIYGGKLPSSATPAQARPEDRSRATSRQPMSRRQKPLGKSIDSIAR